MASSKKKTEIKQAPKHLEKMLFSNYREEEKLQRKIKDLTNNSRLRGYELDREKIQVHNEMRLSKRRNSPPTAVPVASLLATAQKAHKASRPQTREQRREPGGFRRRDSGSTTDPVNEYLLTEFRRVSEVIPSILSSLNKDDKTGDEEEGGAGGGRGGGGGQAGTGRGRVRRATVAGLEQSAINSLAAPLVRLDPDLKAFANKETGNSEDDPDIGNIVSMIRSIKTLRGDIAAKKCYDVTRTRTSFPELLKGIHEEERRGSESDTFTDGACVLLRRKMHKARRASCPAIDVNMANQGGDGSQAGNGAQQPQRRLSRQKSRDAVGMRALLEEEDRQHTQIKVATEWRRYDDIRTRIGHFLQDDKTTSQRRASFPVIISSPDEAIEET